ncbi:RHS repeat domain-containing protein [Natroniella sp. ANB-PHB2]|uniref:RHS repeat domain-containing protein n=1 Tax=Natroniella sp. ANB-PHB2 TaxID=3384444 RepID=UPI0038D384C0
MFKLKIKGKNDKIVENYNYDVYGNPYEGRFQQNSRRSNPFGFTGKRHEVELGLHSFAYRYYNPRSMRWLTVDPIQDGLNWYQYVGGDPVNYVDPLGLQLLKAGEIREAAGMSTGDTDSLFVEQMKVILMNHKLILQPMVKNIIN